MATESVKIFFRWDPVHPGKPYNGGCPDNVGITTRYIYRCYDHQRMSPIVHATKLGPKSRDLTKKAQERWAPRIFGPE